MPKLKTCLVKNLPDDLQHYSNSQDVEAIKEYIGGRKIKEFDSFLCRTDNGDYEELWGIYGIIPDDNKVAYRLR